MVTTQRPVRTEQEARRAPSRVIISAWAAPILVVGQFAMLAIVPVTLVVMGTLRDSRLRALRWWAVALAATYATPLVLWAIGPDRAPSLSKDMDPVFAAVIVVAAAAFILALWVIRARSVQPRTQRG